MSSPPRTAGALSCRLPRLISTAARNRRGVTCYSGPKIGENLLHLAVATTPVARRRLERQCPRRLRPRDSAALYPRQRGGRQALIFAFGAVKILSTINRQTARANQREYSSVTFEAAGGRMLVISQRCGCNDLENGEYCDIRRTRATKAD